MKKLMWMMAFLFTLCLTSCTSCENKPVLESPVKTELVAENIISMDRQDMYLNYANKKDYRWFETCILLEDFLDEDCDGTIAGVSNVFQVVEEFENGADVHVVMFSHIPEASDVQVVHSFWVGDMPMENEQIKVTFKEAFEKVMQVNYPKPHSKHVVLRREIGPVVVNPQYIFGNTQAQLYVDATTGEVRDTNPAFEGYLGMPLGEWP